MPRNIHKGKILVTHPEVKKFLTELLQMYLGTSDDYTFKPSKFGYKSRLMIRERVTETAIAFIDNVTIRNAEEGTDAFKLGVSLKNLGGNTFACNIMAPNNNTAIGKVTLNKTLGVTKQSALTVEMFKPNTPSFVVVLI